MIIGKKKQKELKLRKVNMVNNSPSYKSEKPEFPKWEELTIVPVGTSGQMNSPKGEKGKYEVRYWLTTYARGFGISGSINIDDPKPEPDSYLHIKVDTGNPKTSISKLKLDTNNLSFLLEANSKGRLSQIIVELDATDFKDAINKSYSDLLPFLSYWSFENNSPFIICAIKAKYLKTDSFRFFSLTDGKAKLFPSDKFQFGTNNTRVMGYLGLYREAVNNAISPLYQVFLLHRIREGIYQNRIGKKQLANESIENTSNEVHSDFLGKPYKVVHSKIEQKFRNHFAHFNTTKAGLLKQNPDKFDDFYDCITKWLPVSFYITRQMIQNEL